MMYTMHVLLQIDHPQQQQKGAWRSVVSSQRKRAVIACFQQKSLHSLPRFLFHSFIYFPFRFTPNLMRCVWLWCGLPPSEKARHKKIC